jgi:hypothetical protein
VTGVFEDPTDLANYQTCCQCKVTAETTCFDVNTSEYPLQPHYIDPIRDEIVKDIVRVMPIPEDKINDTTD